MSFLRKKDEINLHRSKSIETADLFGTVDANDPFFTSELHNFALQSGLSIVKHMSDKLNLQVLLYDNEALTPSNLLFAIRALHPSLMEAKAFFHPEACRSDSIFGLVTWKNHKVRIMTIKEKYSDAKIKDSLQGTFFYAELSETTKVHAAHALLFYTGDATSKKEQYQALTIVACAMKDLGGLAVLNHSAKTAMPIDSLMDDEVGDQLAVIENLSLLGLYCGFIKYEHPTKSPVWMCTSGAHLFNFPDFAILTEKSAMESIVSLFLAIFDYMDQTGKVIGSGDSVIAAEQNTLKARTPNKEEDFLSSEGTLLVIEQE